MEIKPPNRVQRLLNLIKSFVRGFKLLFSLHFYQNFFGSIHSIVQLVRNGEFIIRTKYFHEETGNEGLFYSRFQADGDILNMLPKSLPESDLEALCNLHQKKMKQKLDSIWFAPKFIIGAVVAVIVSLINYYGLISRIWGFLISYV